MNSSRINNPKYLSLFLPLNSNIEDYWQRHTISIETGVSVPIYVPTGSPKDISFLDTGDVSINNQMRLDFGTTFTSTNEMTFSCWFKQGYAKHFHTLIGSVDTKIVVGNIQDIVDFGSSGNLTYDHAAMGVLNWNHFVIVRREDNSVIQYVNGLQVKNYGILNGTITLTDGLMLTNGTHPLQGSISDYRLYDNVSLSAQEIQGLYRQKGLFGKPTKYKDIIAKLPVTLPPSSNDENLRLSMFNSKSGSSASDASIFQAAPTQTGTGNLYVSAGEGIFDGQTGWRLNNTSNPALPETDPWTINWWSYVSPSVPLASNGQVVLGQYEGGGNDRTIIRYSDLTYGKTEVFIQANRYVGNTTAKEGRWNHHVITRSGNQLEFYFNGISDGTPTLPSTGEQIKQVENGVGIISPSILGDEFNGKIKNLEVFGDVKDSEWILNKYKASYPEEYLFKLFNNVTEQSKFKRKPSNVSTLISEFHHNYIQQASSESDIIWWEAQDNTGLDTFFQNNFTFSAWISPNFAQGIGHAGGGWVNLFHLESYQTNGCGIIYNNASGDANLGKMIFRVHQSPTRSEVGTSVGTIKGNTWQHIACVKSGLEGYIYHNGEEVASGTFSYHGTTATSNLQIKSYGKISDYQLITEAKDASWINHKYIQTRQYY